MAYKPGGLTKLLAGAEDDDENFDLPVLAKTTEVVDQQNEQIDNMTVSNLVTSMNQKQKRSAKTTGKPKTKKDPVERQHEPASAEQKQLEMQCTIFVGNVAVGTKLKTLKRLFRDCGPIKSMRYRSVVSSVPHLPKKAALIKGKLAESLPALNAYIRFEHSGSVEKALKLSGTVLSGHHLQIDRCDVTASTQYEPGKTVYLGNVPYDATDDELYTAFSDCGAIRLVRLVRDRHTSKGKGFGFVVFQDRASVGLALKLNGMQFKNRPLRISKCQKRTAANSNQPDQEHTRAKHSTASGQKQQRHGNTDKRKADGGNKKLLKPNIGAKKLQKIIRKKKKRSSKHAGKLLT